MFSCHKKITAIAQILLSKSSHFSSLKYKLALMQSSGMFWSSQLSLKNGGSQYNPNNYTEIG